MNEDLAELLTTTRTVRYGLDFDRPVDRRLIRSCMEVARFAPNGANRQGWRFIVLDDPDLRSAIAGHAWGPVTGELPVTASIGVTTGTGSADQTPAALLGRADALLYRAKEQGRNRVVTDAG